MKIGVFGLGEAGSLIAADLVAQGVEIHAFDPANVETPTGVIREAKPDEAVVNADFIIAVTAGSDAVTAIQQAIELFPESSSYADFSTNSAETKQRLASIASQRGIDFTDIALMGTVPGRGIRTPALASGNGASRFVETFSRFSMPVTRISDRAGDAAARKLLRSIMMKGLAGCVIEAMRGAEKAGCSEWLWENIAEEISKADGDLLKRLVSGSLKHATRRMHEMEASAAMLRELGVDPVMADATVKNLQGLTSEGLPVFPATSD